jgi:hypothetical protein
MNILFFLLGRAKWRETKPTVAPRAWPVQRSRSAGSRVAALRESNEGGGRAAAAVKFARPV